MSFPRYQAYKDSGIEWLGQVPSHWSVMPLRRDINFVTSGARGWAENYSDDGDLFIRIGNLTRDSIKLSLSEVQRVIVPDSAEVDRTRVQAGDVLFSITAYLGSVAVVPCNLGKAFVSQHVALVRPKRSCCLPEWIGYVAISHVGKTHLETTGYGGTKIQLSLADVTTMPVLAPPPDEQALLVEFLDRETTKIDALVAEQEELIILLKEKRQSVVSHAVTKGLDPSVPMKNSGVEWLGAVPAHWALRPLKSLATFRSGGTPDKRKLEYWDGDVPWASAKDLKVDRLSDSIDHITQLAVEEGVATLVPANAIVVVVRGMILARYFPVTQLTVPMAINQDLKALLPRRDVASDYLAWLLRASEPETLNCLDEAGHGTKALRMENWGGMTVPVPPIEEQKAIATKIEAATALLDQLVSEAVLSIELLRERRSALISAAVTGQIDVRQLER
jgi:type I restriction enzyme S subunit